MVQRRVQIHSPSRQMRRLDNVRLSQTLHEFQSIHFSYIVFIECSQRCYNIQIWCIQNICNNVFGGDIVDVGCMLFPPCGIAFVMMGAIFHVRLFFGPHYIHHHVINVVEVVDCPMIDQYRGSLVVVDGSSIPPLAGDDGLDLDHCEWETKTVCRGGRNTR